MILIGNILNKKHPVKIIDSTFAIFLIFIGAVLISQMHTLIGSYMNSAIDEMTRTHEIIMENKSNQVNKIIFLEDYFSYIFNKKIPLEQEIKYNKIIDRAKKNYSFRYTSENNDSHNVVINIIGRDILSKYPMLTLKTNQHELVNEINAIQHLFSLLPLTNNNFNVESRIYYVSKSGLYATTTPSDKVNAQSIESTYERMINSQYFINAMKLTKSSKTNIFTTAYEGPNNEGKLITMYVPVIIDGITTGVICFDFEVRKLGVLLNNSIDNKNIGSYFWIDGSTNIIASSESNISAEDRKIANKVLSLTNNYTTGRFYSGFSFVTYKKVKGEYGALFVTHSPLQILKSEYGTQLIFILLLWAGFTFSLLFSYVLIRNLIKKMHVLQHSLEWKASHDTLTNVLNRNGFYSELELALSKLKSTDYPIAIIQIDLDKFKSINDSYGHFAGDMVLIHAAKTIKNNIRKEDVLGRLGGEEFCIFCPSLTLIESSKLAENLRLSINTEKIEVAKNTWIHISASFGVSCSSEINSYDIKKLQIMSDKRLYLAKENGRNKVFSAG